MFVFLLVFSNESPRINKWNTTRNNCRIFTTPTFQSNFVCSTCHFISTTTKSTVDNLIDTLLSTCFFPSFSFSSSCCFACLHCEPNRYRCLLGTIDSKLRTRIPLSRFPRFSNNFQWIAVENSSFMHLTRREKLLKRENFGRNGVLNQLLSLSLSLHN